MKKIANVRGKWEVWRAKHASGSGWKESRFPVSVLRLCAFQQFSSLHLSVFIYKRPKLSPRFLPATSIYESQYKTLTLHQEQSYLLDMSIRPIVNQMGHKLNCCFFPSLYVLLQSYVFKGFIIYSEFYPLKEDLRKPERVTIFFCHLDSEEIRLHTNDTVLTSGSQQNDNIQPGVCLRT